MKMTVFLLIALLGFSGFYPRVSGASRKGPITINQAIEAATGEVHGVFINAQWQRGYLEVSIEGQEVRVEKIYIDPNSGRLVGLNFREDEDFIVDKDGSSHVQLDYVEGRYKIRILRFDGRVSDVYVNESDGRVFY